MKTLNEKLAEKRREKSYVRVWVVLAVVVGILFARSSIVYWFTGSPF